MKNLLFSFSILLCLNSFCQSNFTGLNLEFIHSNNSLISIRIYRINHDCNLYVYTMPANDDPSLKESRIDSTYKITEKQFEELVVLFKKIPIEKILSGFSLSESVGLDGSTIKLELLNGPNGISIKVWSPDESAETRKLKEFLELSQKIVTLAKLNPELLK